MAIVMVKWLGEGKTEKVTSYEGCVLATRERNYHDDSDFYAIVWDEETQSLKSVEYATTRSYTYENSATVDITPENLEKAKVWAFGISRVRVREYLESQENKVESGKEVVVFKGRKVPIGTEAEVVRIKSSTYSTRYETKYDANIRLLDGSYTWTAVSNLKVKEPRTITDEEVDRYARNNAENPVGVYLSLTVPRSMVMV